VDAVREARTMIVSSIMGVFRPDQLQRLKAAGVAWFERLQAMQAWAGQSTRRAPAPPATEVVTQWWTQTLLCH